MKSADSTSSRRAFTLIETMLAVLLLAMVASAAALNFSKPIARARGEDAIEQLRAFDANTRAAAVGSGKLVRLAFVLQSGTLERRDGPELKDVRFTAHLPPGCRIDAIRIGTESMSDGEALLDVSAMGLSRTYAVHLLATGVDRWVVFAGMSGEMKEIADESSLEEIFSAGAR